MGIFGQMGLSICPDCIKEEKTMQLFLATHGKMASGMMSSVELLIGKAHNLTVFDAYMDQRSLKDEIELFLYRTDAKETRILISDIYGGSVNQVMMNYMNKENTYVITGINLSILLSLLLKPGNISKNELNNMIQESKAWICILDEEELDKFSNDDLFDEE